MHMKIVHNAILTAPNAYFCSFEKTGHDRWLLWLTASKLETEEDDDGGVYFILLERRCSHQELNVDEFILEKRKLITS